MDWLKRVLGEQLFALVIKQLLTKENLDKFLVELLDAAEKLAEKTETKIDDRIVARLREILGK